MVMNSGQKVFFEQFIHVKKLSIFNKTNWLTPYSRVGVVDKSTESILKYQMKLLPTAYGYHPARTALH